MWTETEIRARLALLLAAGGDTRQLYGVLERYGSAETALKSPSLRARLKDSVSRPESLERVAQELSLAGEMGARWIATDELPILCVRGQLTPGPAVAIVGTREADSYGLAVATSLGTALAQADVTVISGAARGVDEAAHRAAIAAGGRTVAVLGTGVLGERDPARRRLLDEISENGAVVSEYLMKARGARWTFPERNRIIARLGQATIVVQAPRKSGALITARHSRALGRPVFAVPGDVVHPLSAGCNHLIATGEARLFAHPRDLVNTIGVPQLDHVPWPIAARGEAIQQPGHGLGMGLQGAPILALLCRVGALRFEELQAQLPEMGSDLAEVLFDLELKGQVRRQAGDSYATNTETA